MTWKKIRAYLLGVLLILCSIFALFVLGGYGSEQFDITTESLSSNQMGTTAFTEGMTLRQTFPVRQTYLDQMTIPVAAGDQVHMQYRIMAGEKILLEKEVHQSLTEPEVLLEFDDVVIEGYSTIALEMTALADNNLQFFFGDQIQLARGIVPISGLNQENCFVFHGEVLHGKLNVKVVQYTPYHVIKPLIILFVVMLCGWVFLYWHSKKHYTTGNFFTRAVYTIDRYYFLSQQLVARDFKSKYKRSILGVFWSFLNPLFTMAVQYVVFSTLFQSSISYFPVYLFTGTVCFSIFTESTSLGLTSISGNAQLLTKVYIPKYIFPVASVATSVVNFGFTLIPLIAVILFSGLPITTAWLFLPYTILCLIVFCLGVSLFLAAVMVFFRDIQFIWGVLTTVMMYATPIFYPESIIPDAFAFMYTLNPVYHVIRIMRNILINGAVPTAHALVVCTLACASVFIVGAITFKKTQDKFVLYL